MKYRKTGLAMAMLLGYATSLQGAIVTQPTGLNVGDTYRLIFVTSTTTQATNSTAEYYNNFVNNLAQSVPALAALGTTWKVAGNLNGINPWENTGTTGSDAISIYRLDDTVFAANYTALKGAPTVPVLYNEKGEAMNAGGVGAGRVWTGMTEAMSVPGFNPANYIGYGGSVDAGATDGAWYTWGFHSMDNTTENHLYAMSGVITVIPEPSAALLGGLGLLALLRRRRSA